MAVQNGTVFWADNVRELGSIGASPTANMSAFSVLVRHEGRGLQDLKIFSRQLQQGTNACAVRNGGCEHLCLFNGTHPICACSYAQLAADGRSCRPYVEFLLYSNIRSIESLHVVAAAPNASTTTAERPGPPLRSIRNETMLRNAIALGYDLAGGRVFYSDIASQSINVVPFNSSGRDHRVLVAKQVSVEGLCYDPRSEALFWTSNRNASIRSARLADVEGGAAGNANGRAVRTVIRLSAADKPRGIAVEPCLGMMYWTNWNAQAPAIQRAFVTGYGVETIIRRDIQMPNAITLDTAQNKLYWADARLDKIERANYDGSERVVVFHSAAKHPFAIAVWGDELFWTDWVLNAVMRANKYSGGDVVYMQRGVLKPMGIVAVQNTTRECSPRACDTLNGGCEDVCMVLELTGAVRCECSQGRLAKDGRRCVPAAAATQKEHDEEEDSADANCPADAFRCHTQRQCIPLQLTCDRIEHCADGSDEAEGYCNWRRCPAGWFECANRRCIPLKQTCDGVQHCGDGSDEAGEQCKQCEAPGAFRCEAGGRCLAAEVRCNGEFECPDGSDERGCAGGVSVTCKEGDGWVPCAGNSTECYMRRGRCDGRSDCADNADERDCGAANRTCGKTDYV